MLKETEYYLNLCCCPLSCYLSFVVAFLDPWGFSIVSMVVIAKFATHWKLMWLGKCFAPSGLFVAGGEQYTMETACATNGRKMSSKSGRKEDGVFYFFFPSPQQFVLVDLHSRDVYQLHPGWMDMAQYVLPRQGRWHALLCRQLFTQGMFALYFIACPLKGEKRAAYVCKLWIMCLP